MPMENSQREKPMFKYVSQQSNRAKHVWPKACKQQLSLTSSLMERSSFSPCASANTIVGGV